MPFAPGLSTLKMRTVSRGAIIALAVLLITATLLLVFQPDDRAIPYSSSPTHTLHAHTRSALRSAVHGKYAARYYRASNAKQQQPMPSNEVTMNEEEELAALTAFLTALSTNVLPPAVNPSRPLDPQLVLDFAYDPQHNPGARAELATLMRDLWDRHPVVLYGKHFSADCRALKAFLASLALSPPPTLIDVDTRDDASVLRPLLARLTGVNDLPVLLIGGKVFPYGLGAMSGPEGEIVSALTQAQAEAGHKEGTVNPPPSPDSAAAAVDAPPAVPAHNPPVPDTPLPAPALHPDLDTHAEGNDNTIPPPTNPDPLAAKGDSAPAPAVASVPAPAPVDILPLLQAIHAKERLAPILRDAGAIVGGARRRKGRK